jgi:hypothetical protein
MTRFLLLFLPLLLLQFSVSAQGIHIKAATGPIVIDGVMDEDDWKRAEVAKDFMQFFPFDTAYASAQTEVRLTYDDKNLYVFAIMYNGSNSYVTPSLRRDFRGEANDGFTFVIDTYKDKTNAFFFGVNPYGVQREGLIFNGGVSNADFSMDWDNKWFSEAIIHDGYWTLEMAIPFKSLRYKEGQTQWNVNFYRLNSYNAERSTWTPIPRNFLIFSPAFTQTLHWDRPLENPGSNISLIPFIAGNSSRNYEAGTPSNNGIDFGGDAKIAVGPALNLDLTINPDFSQVEVDQQVTNLDRFEIFFPERRQFFLENADLFANFGFEGTRPFFSRRIGVARDSSTGQNIQNPIYFGARLSGKIDNNWRVGIMNMQAGKIENIGLPSTNYSIAALQRKVFTRSNISFLFINKQAFKDSINGEFTTSPDKFNRLAGLDYNLSSKDNKWNGKVFYHRSFQNNRVDSAYAAGAQLIYSTLRWEFNSLIQNTGAGYNPEVGFVRRTDVIRYSQNLWSNNYPNSSWLQNHGPGISYDVTRNEQYGLLDYDLNLMYRARLKNNAFFQAMLRREYVYLFAPFDPTNTGGVQLAADTDYTYDMFLFILNSDARKKFFFNVFSRFGTYFNGSRTNIRAESSYRFQPYGVFSLLVDYNRITLPQPYASADLILIGPRIDLTFTRNVFWTTFVQYNNQINNLNINSRFQWRFKPVSDLFIVYTDNYFPDTWIVKSRAIVMKLTYWINL